VRNGAADELHAAVKTFGSDARGPLRAGHPVAVVCGLLAVLLAFAWGRVYERHILQPQLETVIRLRDTQQAKAYAPVVMGEVK
jgi:hypothetical protein